MREESKLGEGGNKEKMGREQGEEARREGTGEGGGGPWE
jgi:hypothetical protein